MKKSLSVFIALAMVLSLFAGVGARSAKAATTLTVTSSGNFTGGLDGVGAAAVNAVGTVTAIIDSAHATVNVTTAGVGIFDAAGGNVAAWTLLPANSYTQTSIDSNWGILGNELIAFNTVAGLQANDVITVAGTIPGVGTVKSLINTTLAYVNVTTAIVGAATDSLGIKTGVISKEMRLSLNTINSVDEGWRTLGTKTIAFTSGTPTVGESLDVTMDLLQPAIAATAFLTIGGGITAGNMATVTWQDTTGASHTASYTTVSGDTLTSVTNGLISAINSTVGGLVTAKLKGTSLIGLDQIVAGTAGNGKTLTASITVTATSLIIHTLGGLASPASVEVGKTLQLVAVDPTGAIVAATWTSNSTTTATITSTGLVMAMTNSGVSLVTATYGTYTGTFAVVAIPPQTITSLVVNLVPASLKVAGQQQFGAIGASASTAYAALDYTTQATWSDTLPVGIVSNVAPAQGSLVYSTPETGSVSAYVASLGATVTVTINAAGAVTIATVPVAVKRVIVLTVGTDIVTVDGQATTVDAAPEIVASRTFVPIRFIAETFGSTVVWIPATRSITITLGSTAINLQIGNATAVIKGKIVALDAAPYIKNSRSMVPLRVITESFGGNVVWDAINHIITITYLLP
jgi:hypothetical protein